MKIQVADTYEELSQQAADEVLQLMQASRHPLFCPASGDTPAGLYRALTERARDQQLDLSRWNYVGLDEWVGMNGSDEGSCRYHLDRQLFHPLQVHEEQICFFDGRAHDLQGECDRVEDFIRRLGGIEVAVLGLGLNGHIGMNEPGTAVGLRSHVTNLDPITQQVGQKYFTQQQQLSRGITLGLHTLLEARHLILMVSGAHKAEIVRRALEEEISEQLPATLLRRHSGLSVLLDRAAAESIQSF
jgi:glucosamine-6-phosphate isomerase